MVKAVILALAASFCTATSSVCQRLGAATAPGGERLSPRLLLYLVRQPIWLAGIASMILGFVFQVAALHFGDLALVQPILATELLFVFAYMALIGTRRVARYDWLAAAAMAVGLGVFLFTASPSGGHLHAPGGLVVVRGDLRPRTGARRHDRGVHPHAARHGAVTGPKGGDARGGDGISWGFVAAVIKELSSHTGAGFSIFLTWSPYVLVAVGAASMLLSTHAFQAGPLAASQPGFTIVDPLVASLLGVFIFDEHLQLSPLAVLVEAAALGALVAGVVAISRSQLVQGQTHEDEAGLRPVTTTLDVRDAAG